jgi:hypothetical protein
MEHWNQSFDGFRLQSPNLPQLFDRMKPTQCIPKSADAGGQYRTDVRQRLKCCAISGIYVQDGMLSLLGMTEGFSSLW